MALNRVRRSGAYAPLSAHYYKDDAIDEAGPDAELLYVRGLAFCAEMLNDGFISDRQLTRFVGSGLDDVHGRAKALTAVGLWERADGGYVVRSWLEWNRSRAEITRHQERDAARKRGEVQADDAEPPPDRPRGAPKTTPADSTPPSARTPRGIPAESATPSEKLHAPDTDLYPDTDPKKEETLPLAVLAGRDKLDRWPEFWAAYPRKTNKANAEKAYRAAIKRGADPDRLIEVALRYAAEKAGSEPRHIAHGASWLNGRRYEDPPEPLRLVSGGNSNGYRPFQGFDESDYDGGI